MKMIYFLLALFLAGMLLPYAYGQRTYKPQTLRQTPQYLSTDPALVEDTCMGHDILNQFTCTHKEPAGYSCFDVYMVQGDPIDAERYTLLQETLSVENATPEPPCNFDGPLTCENFLKSLNYDLDFSWFIDNFPSSSFPQCGETYSCTRLACLKALPTAADGSPRTKKLSCVFKKNQIFFLGTAVFCQAKN